MTDSRQHIANPDSFQKPDMFDDVRDFLDEKHLQYNNKNFIINDPIAVPHLFTARTDIEIAGFLTAIISWGRREMIAKAGNELMRRMDYAPTAFVTQATDVEIASLNGFVYRTFNALDAQTFILALKKIYSESGSLENAFFEPVAAEPREMDFLINRFRKRFFSIEHLPRTQKHLSDPLRNSAAKRINMFLRWMVRNDNKGVDFGIWKSIPPSCLVCPLDLHSARVARKLGLLLRRQNDWKAAAELTECLKKFDPDDPVKYDFALFGLGWYEKF
jgi:uncharacterized protein (TIGR02757 family)